MIKRANLACKYFPCHKGLEDCTCCYCPFYPCLDEAKGKYIFSLKTGKNIWSCQDCNWIHKRKNIDMIFELIRKNAFRPKINPIKSGAQKIAIIILGHGSKRKQANKTISGIVKEIRKQNLGIVEPASLQFHHPDLFISVKKVIAKGCNKIIIIPFFLFKGNHVARDIPQAIQKARTKHPEVEFIYARNLGDDPRIKEIVLDSIREAIK